MALLELVGGRAEWKEVSLVGKTVEEEWGPWALSLGSCMRDVSSFMPHYKF